MTSGMPRQKGHRDAIKFANNEHIRWRAKWRRHWLFSDILKLGHLVKTRAADNSDLTSLYHDLLLVFLSAGCRIDNRF
jgi:hypothetical protein